MEDEAFAEGVDNHYAMHRKGGDILTCGFPASQLDTVLQRLREAGGVVEQVGEKTFLFRGLDGTPDKKLIAEQKPQAVTFSSKDMPQSEASFSWLPPYQIGYSCSV